MLPHTPAPVGGKVTPMSVSATLLRLILSVVLILDGVGATSLPAGHAGSGLAPTTVAGIDLPCHADAMTGNPSRTARSAGVPLDRSQPDCCESGACRWACLHHAQLTGMAMQMPAPVIERAAYLPAAPAGHVPPTLPDLIRPPIG